MANRASVRAVLKSMRCKPLRGPLPIASSARDLGAHLNLGARAVGPTMISRMQKARAAARALST
eukprot:205721-Alexandrium_andersonii.AAC.1